MAPFTILADTTNSDGGCIIEPLFLTIHFSGTTALHLPSHVPVEVLIKLPDELSDRFYPVVAGELSLPKDKLHCKYSRLHLQLNVFSFFLLERRFDYQNKQHWHSLTDEIQCVLLKTPEDGKQLRCGGLMLDFFWMAFVAAYPSFPGGEWVEWDAHIPMDGTFINTWLRDPGLQQVRESLPEVARQFLFDKLKESVRHFFSISIMASL